MCMTVLLCTTCVLGTHELSDTGFIDGCGLTYGCWDSHPEPLCKIYS